VLLRGSGISWDLRKNNPYEIYNDLEFSIHVGKNGDCYDRYLIRIMEMRESINIIHQCINLIPTGAYKSLDNKIFFPSRKNIKYSM
jgi:NADH dehydrogenase (ubiquinone) Fe-S protein 2